MAGTITSSKLENLGREELLQTVRRLLVEADALSSRIAAVGEIGAAINQTLELETIERVIAKQAKWLLDFEHLSVCLHEGDGWQLKTLFGEAPPAPVNCTEAESLGTVLKTGHPQLVNNEGAPPFLGRYLSRIIIPLIADKTLLGTINFASTKAGCYSHDDMRIGYMLSLQLSGAIRNARIFEQLQQTQDELKQRVEELDAYGHTIAHDLKSPLSNIMLRSELLRLLLNEKQPQMTGYVESVHESAQQMQRMIDQLLWLARLRNTQEAISPVPMRPVVNAAFQRFAVQLESREIQTIIPPDLPPAMGHMQWLEEVFANLISNAIKYMGENNPSRCIEIRGESQGDMVRYEVRDTGVGIQPEDQSRLFEMFTRLHTVKAEGVGLGLSIVNRIMKRLNGQIGVTSTPGEGSIFWLMLPAEPTEAAQVPEESEETQEFEMIPEKALEIAAEDLTEESMNEPTDEV